MESLSYSSRHRSQSSRNELTILLLWTDTLFSNDQPANVLIQDMLNIDCSNTISSTASVPVMSHH